MRATPSSRHPLPPPLPVTLRKEKCNCSCPSKREGAQLTSFFTPPTESQTLLVSLPTPPPHPFYSERPKWAEFPRPLHVSLSQSRGALTLSPTGLGGVGKRSPLQRSGSRYAGGRGVRRRGPGDRPPPPPPGAPASRPAQALRQGAGGEGARGRPGSRRRPQRLGSAKMARGSAGSRRRRRLGGTGPGLGRLPSSHSRGPLVPRRGPSAGGPTHSPPPPPPPLGRGRSQREERPRAGRPAAGRGPQGPGGLRGSPVPRALGP